MANFPGIRAYPNAGNYAMCPTRDDGPLTKVSPTSLRRGGTTADYNVKLRGQGVRSDKIPGL